MQIWNKSGHVIGPGVSFGTTFGVCGGFGFEFLSSGVQPWFGHSLDWRLVGDQRELDKTREDEEEVNDKVEVGHFQVRDTRKPKKKLKWKQ